MVWWFKRKHNIHAQLIILIKMNKKAEAYPIEKVVGILIIITCFVIVFLGFFAPEEGWLNKIAETAESWARFIPGKDKLPAVGEENIPSDIREFYDDLYDKLILLSESDTQECLLDYKELPNFKKYSIVLEKSVEDDGTYMWIHYGDQRFDNLFIPNIKPCIVAGKEGVFIIAENFLVNYGFKIPQHPMNLLYKESSSLIISKGGKLTVEGEDTDYDLNEHSNIIYKYDKNHICFIPYAKNTLFETGCHGKEQGITQPCFDLIKSYINIPNCQNP